MNVPPAHRRSVRHYHDPGDLHELTFSCYHRLSLLTNDHWQRLLAESIERATASHGFSLVAFVFMPEHVHLLVSSRSTEPAVDRLLYAIKRPYSYRIKQILLAAESPLLDKLSVRNKQGKPVFRFWQKGPGYDRNLKTVKAVTSSIDYIHNNPVNRGLCRQPVEWKWSSTLWYVSDGRQKGKDHPTIHPLPPEFFD